jgi:hypothetical protein
MKNRRKHSKIDQLPEEVVKAVHELLVSPGVTYNDVVSWLKQKGHEVSKSAVGRYSQHFLGRLERLQAVKDQAKAIIEANPDAPATEMHEAANQLAVQLIMEKLMELPDLEGAKITEILKALALLERSAVSREKLKMEFRSKVQQAVDNIEQTGRQKGLDPETLTYIKEQVYGIV